MDLMRPPVNVQQKQKNNFAADVVRPVFNVIMVNALIWTNCATVIPSAMMAVMNLSNTVRPLTVPRTHSVVETVLVLVAKRNVIYA